MNDLECLIQLKNGFQGGKPDVRMLLLSQLTICDWMNVGSDKNVAAGQCVVSDHMRLVHIFAGFTA